MSSKFLEQFVTDDYYLAVEDSALADYNGTVYHVVNKHTLVTEHESPFISEAIGYLLALQEKLLSATEAFYEDQAESEISTPNLH